MSTAPHPARWVRFHPGTGVFHSLAGLRASHERGFELDPRAEGLASVLLSNGRRVSNAWQRRTAWVR
jgi:hypothetical protein